MLVAAVAALTPVVEGQGVLVEVALADPKVELAVLQEPQIQAVAAAAVEVNRLLEMAAQVVLVSSSSVTLRSLNKPLQQVRPRSHRSMEI